MDTIFEFLCGTGAGDAPAGERKKLLIIGGSFGGLVTLRCLKKNGGTKHLDVTLVDAQDYWDYCLASPRCLVDPSQFEAQQFGMPLEGICDHLGATFKQGKVETLTKESATLAGGDAFALTSTRQRGRVDGVAWDFSVEPVLGRRRRRATGACFSGRGSERF